MTISRNPEADWTPEVVSQINNEAAERNMIDRWIDDWSVDGDIKLLLKWLSEQTMAAGRVIVRVGSWIVTHLKKIFDEVVSALARGMEGFKYTLTGAVLGMALQLILVAFPMFGIFGSMLGSIIALGVMCTGIMADATTLAVKGFVDVAPAVLKATV